MYVVDIVRKEIRLEGLIWNITYTFRNVARYLYIKDLFSTREVGDRTTSERLDYLWHVALSNIPLIIVARRVVVTSNLHSVRSGLITFNLPDLPCRRKHVTIRKHFYHVGNLLSKSSRVCTTLTSFLETGVSSSSHRWNTLNSLASRQKGERWKQNLAKP